MTMADAYHSIPYQPACPRVREHRFKWKCARGRRTSLHTDMATAWTKEKEEKKRQHKDKQQERKRKQKRGAEKRRKAGTIIARTLQKMNDCTERK